MRITRTEDGWSVLIWRRRGKVIRFSARDFSVYVRKIRKTVDPRLGLKEKTYWKKNIDTQEQKIVKPDIWE